MNYKRLKGFTKRSTKSFMKTILVFLIAVAIAIAPATALASPPSIEAKAYIVVDADTGEILAERNSEEVLVPASMTKLMTVYLTLENINNHKISWSDEVVISEQANRISRHSSLSSYPLPLGDKYSVQDLFYGAVLNSSNASTVSLAEHIGGDESAFVGMMNEKARNFGLTDTRFVNPSGLNNSDLFGNHPQGAGRNDDTKLSARSMALIAYRLLNDYPEVVGYTSMTQATIREGLSDERVIRTTNRLLPTREMALDGALGLKTGYIFNAGFCFAGYTSRPSGRLISVVMGATTSNERFRGSARLLEYGYTILEERAASADTAAASTGTTAASAASAGGSTGAGTSTEAGATNAGEGASTGTGTG